MKKIMLVVSMLVFLTFSLINVSAYNEDYINKHGGSKEDIERNAVNQKLILEKDKDVDSIRLFGWGDTISPAIIPVEQSKGYYCGPANIVMILRNIKGSSLSQDSHANNMGTNPSDGTIVYRMTNELNNQQNKYTYAHFQISDRSSFSNYMENSIARNAPVVLHAKTGSLNMYNGNSLGHYLTGETVIADGSSTVLTRIGYVDPLNRDYGKGNVFGSHIDTFENVYEAVKGRFVIRGQYR